MEATIRELGNYKNLSIRFAKHCEEFCKQYCSIYTIRLQKMTSILFKQAQKEWKNSFPIVELHKLDAQNKKCIVVGTLFKDQKLKPSLLKHLSENSHLQPHSKVTHFTDESDVLYIENKFLRYQLLGLDNSKLVTGVTGAFLVKIAGSGQLMVYKCCFADYGPQIDLPLSNFDVFLVFISGLNLSDRKNLLPLDLFISWIGGLLGGLNGLDALRIARLILAGNSIANKPQELKQTASLISKTNVDKNSIEAVQVFDKILYKLCQHIDVHVIPGKYDPSDFTLPQKPMHNCMFPNSRLFKSLHLESNPFDCEINGVRILGTSGEPVKDILDFSDIESPLDALESCLKWSHIAPTAPDTLGCFPFDADDPFVIEECPHVFFAGNQKEFNTKVSVGKDGQEVRLICVPDFSESCTVAVINLKTLDCFPIIFNM